MATAEDVWQLLAEIAKAQKENDRQLKEFRQAQQEAQREAQQAQREAQQAQREAQQAQREAQQAQREAQQETNRQLEKSREETDRQLKEFRQAQQEAQQAADRQLEKSREEFDHKLKESREEFDHKLKESREEHDRMLRELGQEMKELDQQVKELGKQIGGLGKKFGSFTEGLALPSMDRILRQRFAMETVSPRVRVRKGGEEIEIDVLAYTNGDRNVAYVVEVKSHPREEAIEQMKRLLARFPQFFPEHRDKELYGILAAVDLSAEVRRQILAEGLYVARIEEDVFTLDVPEDFQPRVWSTGSP